ELLIWWKPADSFPRWSGFNRMLKMTWDYIKTGVIVEEQILISVTTEEYNRTPRLFLIYSYFTNASLNPAFFAFSSCISAFFFTLYAPICTRYSFLLSVDGLVVVVPFANSFFTSARNVSIDFPCLENQGRGSP